MRLVLVCIDGPADTVKIVSYLGLNAPDAKIVSKYITEAGDLTGDDPELADALAIASSLRRAAPSPLEQRLPFGVVRALLEAPARER